MHLKTDYMKKKQNVKDKYVLKWVLSSLRMQKRKKSYILPYFLKHELLMQYSKAEHQFFFQLNQDNPYDPAQPGKPPLMYM